MVLTVVAGLAGARKLLNNSATNSSIARFVSASLIFFTKQWSSSLSVIVSQSSVPNPKKIFVSDDIILSSESVSLTISVTRKFLRVGNRGARLHVLRLHYLNFLYGRPRWYPLTIFLFGFLSGLLLIHKIFYDYYWATDVFSYRTDVLWNLHKTVTISSSFERSFSFILLPFFLADFFKNSSLHSFKTFSRG